MNRNRIGRVFSVIAVLGWGWAVARDTPVTPPPPKDPIHVRTMTNLKGATSENGHPYYLGIKDSIAEANETGGIKGYPIVETTVNHDYMAAMWTAAYETWKADPDFAKTIQFFSWGTPDTQAFSKDATMREVPWISGSYATTLATPLPQTRTVRVPGETMDRMFVAEGAPYNFFAGTDYSTQVRIAMDFVKKRGGGTKIAFAYCTGSSFCKEPIPPGKTYAASIGLTIAPDINPELGDNYDAIDGKVAALRRRQPRR